MINKSSIRTKNKGRFAQCIKLRKQGLSYREIKDIVPVSKSTLNNWLTLAGLTMKKEHLEIQTNKRIANKNLGTEASKITRKRNKENSIQKSISQLRKNFNKPDFTLGLMLYEAEGNKKGSCRFSNSDYRLIIVFIKFIERYFKLDKKSNMKLSLYIHETRKNDLQKIKNFWSKRLNSHIDHIYWKKNIIAQRRNNPDYLGQISVEFRGEKYLTEKLLAISDIILKQNMKN